MEARPPFISRWWLLLVLAVVPDSRALDRVVQQSYPVGAGCALRLDSYRGSVEVKPIAVAEIRIAVNLQVFIDDDREADRLLGRLQLEMKQDYNTVTVIARNPSETRFRFAWQEKQQIKISYTVSVPAGCTVDIATADGDIVVGDLTGPVRAHTHRGAISIRHVYGDIAATTDSGDIIGSHCAAAATLKTLHGMIRVGTIEGAADFHTVNGDIEVQHALGGINAFAEEGHITAGFGKAFGPAAKFATDGGDITLYLDPAVHCTLAASSVWGHVHTNLPFAVQSGGDGRKSLAGQLNGGGSLLTVHADGGQVRIIPPKN